VQPLLPRLSRASVRRAPANCLHGNEIENKGGRAKAESEQQKEDEPLLARL